MINEKMERIVFLAVVAERKQRDAILSALLDEDIHLINTIYGKGTVNAGYLMNTFGLVPELNKVLIVCVTTEKKSNAAMKMLAEKFDFAKPNTGIAFIMPVDNISF